MIKEKIADFRRKLHGLSFAYNRVFDKQSVHTQPVLKDLAKFCRAHETTYHPDPRIHAVLEGRREVWLRIQEHLQLSMEDIYELHKIREIIPKGEKN